MANKVKLKTLVEKMNLKNLTPDVDLSEKVVEIPDINRPALQLTGFFEHFDSERVQIIGYVEYTFLEKMTDEAKKKQIYETLLSYKIPCLIFCRNLPPEAMLLEMAEKANIPVFQTEKKTSEFTAEIIRWLNVELAPCISIHGVLVDVYGVGVLIMGESGIGKSEAALELIKRGHRLVSDDVVEIRRVSDETLWKSGIRIKHMTVWDLRKNIQNFSEIKWFATIFQSVRDVILRSLLRLLLLTTDRNRWDTMPHRNCTSVYSRT